MTKREKHLLWMILNKTIGRYILSICPVMEVERGLICIYI